jgi:hypothetical protein
MASRKKQNGCTALRRIEEAMRKARLGIKEMFEHAFHKALKPPANFNISEQAERFKRYRDDGADKHPGYKIPACVIEFAERLLAAKCVQAILHPQQASLPSRIAPPVMRPQPRYA